ncbi:PKD domain-containing protein [Candidatus Palauibacter sp.]|uniref:PKD domain-containing protein n=1 Tax=Candidatus Palauibacter sp. TaxID=3101350 RepID=UPI003B591C4A
MPTKCQSSPAVFRRSALVIVAALAVLAAVAACSDEPDGVTGVPTRSEAPSSSARQASRLSAAGVSTTGSMAAQGWFDIAIDAGSSFKPGLPVDLEVTYRARFATSSADLRVTLPEIEVAKRSGWDRTYKTDFGLQLPATLHSRQPLAAGETTTQTTVLWFPVAGLYRIHARATAAEFQPSDAATPVTRTTHEYLWVLVDDEGGRTLRDFDPSVIPAGFVPEPGPFRRFGAPPRSRGSDAPAGSRGLANTTSASAAGGRNTADCATGDLCFQVQYYDYESTELKPVPALPYSLAFTVTGGNGSGSSHTGLTGEDGRFTVSCPLLRTPEYQGKASFPMSDSEVIIRSDAQFESALAGNSCGYVTEVTILSAEAKTWITAKRMIAKSRETFRPADREVTFLVNPDYAIYDNTPNTCWYLPDDEAIVVLEGRGGGNACLWGPWGPFVFAHEYGHALHAFKLGGLADFRTCAGHRAFQPAEMGCAYNEGWADYHAVRTEPEYDQSTYQYHYNTEEDYENNRGIDSRHLLGMDGPRYTYFTSGDQDGSLYHGEITAFFHDLIDPINEPHDSLELAMGSVLDAMRDCRVTLDGTPNSPQGIDHLIWCLEGRVDATKTSRFTARSTHPTSVTGANITWSADDLQRLWLTNLFRTLNGNSVPRPTLPSIPGNVDNPLTIIPPPDDSVPPTAALEVSCEDFDCRLDGSGSSDIAGIVSYTWYVDDVWVGSGSSDNFQHKVSWRAAVNDTVSFSLSVEDPSGWWGFDRDTLIIIDGPPTAHVVIEDCMELTCTLDGSESSDDHSLASYTWYVDGDSVAAGPESSRRHVFPRAGGYVVKLTVADSAGHTDSATHPPVSLQNQPPTASYAAECEGLVCVLDGSGSADDGGIANYTWYVEGDSVASSAESTLLYTFAEAGRYYVSLRVRDGAGQTAWSGGTVLAGDPVATFALPGQCEADHWCTFSAAGSSAPGGVSRYAWHVDGDNIGSVPHPFQTYGHTFGGVGEYRVRLTVVESSSGRTADTTRVLHITSDSSWLADVATTDAPPVAAFAARCEGRACALDGSGSTDDVGIEAYAWAVDGVEQASPAEVGLAHRFGSDGMYAVRLIVTDSASQADTLSKDVTVEDLPPVAGFTVRCDELACVFDGSTSTDDLGVATYAWAVDGASAGTGPSSTLAYTFAGAGTYSVRLQVSDTAVPAQTSDSTLSVTVPRDEAPVAAFEASCTGRACTLDGSSSTDDVGIEAYAWAVDGVEQASSAEASLAHRFGSDGTYAVRLIVTDSSSQADTLSRNVIVEDLPPAAGLTVSCDSLACVFDGSTSTDDLGIATYTWLVDGAEVATGAADTLAHTFASAQTYSVGLRVADTAVPPQTADSTLRVVVGGTQPPPPPPTHPDLEVGTPSVSDATPETGAAFTLSATVTNTGDGASGPTTLHYYRSTDATIGSSDTAVGTDPVGGLAPGGTSAESISVTAPSTAGTYHYGACVDAVSGESDTRDNCSAPVRVDVEDPPPPTRPDLEVGAPSVSDATPETGAAFTLSATVTNTGDGASGPTTLRYYRSTDATIGSSDTAVGTDPVGPLGAGGTSAESISVTAPSTAGTYYYGACVDAVAGESDTTDNCSASARVDPTPPTHPNLEVGAPTVSDRAPQTGAAFTLSATVTNAGDGASGPTTLRYYRSTDATIGSSDTAVGTDPVGALGAGGTSAESISVTAPSTAGTYYYGACVDAVAGESDTTDNCSASARVDPTPPTHPNLEVGAPTVSDRAPQTGAAFTLSATVTNAGDGASGPTTLRYYRSANTTINSSDTPVGTDQVGALAAGGTSAESISLDAPSTAGTYHYGACVDAVAGESDTRDNCSASVRVVPDSPPTAILDVTCTGRDCTLDGSNSTDDDGITNYAFEVDGTSVGSGTATSRNHTFPSNGTYTVTLTVEDTADPPQTGTDSRRVTVRDDPPVARFTYGCDANRECTFNGSSSTDDVGIESYTWSVLEGPRSVGGGEGAIFRRTFGYGTWIVTLGVADKLGQTGSTSETLNFDEPDDPPVARLTVRCDELECTFDGSDSDDDHGIESYTWSVDGSRVETGASSSTGYTFQDAGTYTVGLTVADSGGQTDSASESVTVVSDDPPTAILSVSCTGRECTFEGLDSTDDNGITTYAWEVDGAAVGSGSSTSHTFASDGTYSVTLTVTDTKGQTGSASEDVTVRDDPPVASFTYNCTGLTCTFDASGSSDDIGIARYHWGFVEGPRSSTSPILTRTFSSAGSWQVSLNVQDTAGQTGSTSQTIDVSSM